MSKLSKFGKSPYRVATPQEWFYRNQVCLELLRADKCDPMVKEMLQMLCKSFCLVCKHLGDRGHIIYDVSAEKLDHDTCGIPKTNSWRFCSFR